MKYWVDWDNSCIVFGKIKNDTFMDLSGNWCHDVPQKDVCSSLEEAESILLSHYV